MLQELMRFYEEALPEADRKRYGTAFFAAFAEHALRVREEFSRCGELPEELFLPYVAGPRVNDEELADCRELFYGELRDRVRGLTTEQAILEVNRWCAGHVVYRSTDAHTDSPLAVYRRGYGRCGEESVFAVNALRSVGIAARQVYAPRWSHCDDNHAWVEAWDGRSWRYFGACEPEPVLDRGWFNSAASRAMLVHARAFLPKEPSRLRAFFPGTDPVDLWREGDAVFENVTARYAETKLFSAAVERADGSPASGAAVKFSVLNMAEFYPIASRKADENGKVEIRLGLGTVLVSACADGHYAERLAEVSEEGGVKLVLTEPAGTFGEGCREFTFHAPAGGKAAAPSLTEGQRKQKLAWQKEAAALWESRHGSGKELPPPVFPGNYEAAPAEGTGTARLTLEAGEQACLFRQNYTLSRREKDGFFTVATPDLSPGEEALFSPGEGEYRLLTVNRLPSGDQLARVSAFTLGGGEARRERILFRKEKRTELLRRLPLPPLYFLPPQETPYRLTVFLQPGEEPTEHLRYELDQSGETLAALAEPCEVCFVTEEDLPDGEFFDVAQEYARNAFVEPDRLPLLLLTDREDHGLFAVSGYRVGVAELLCGLLKDL